MSMNDDAGFGHVLSRRDALALLGSDSRLDATAVQTVGAKGWDGFAFAVVK